MFTVFVHDELIVPSNYYEKNPGPPGYKNNDTKNWSSASHVYICHTFGFDCEICGEMKMFERER